MCRSLVFPRPCHLGTVCGSVWLEGHVLNVSSRNDLYFCPLSELWGLSSRDADRPCCPRMRFYISPCELTVLKFYFVLRRQRSELRFVFFSHLIPETVDTCVHLWPPCLKIVFRSRAPGPELSCKRLTPHMPAPTIHAPTFSGTKLK